MARFNLEDYEPVEDRLARFHDDHKAGRVLTELVHHGDGQWIVKASVYRDETDDRPAASGYAHEVTGEGMVNKTSALENCETSAIGRALANLGYAPKGKRPSREEMVKANGASEVDLAPLEALIVTAQDVGLEKDWSKTREYASQSEAHLEKAMVKVRELMAEAAA